MHGLKGITHSKKMVIVGLYVLLSTALAVSGVIEGLQWAGATSPAIMALVGAQAYQDKGK